MNRGADKKAEFLLLFVGKISLFPVPNDFLL